MRTLLKEQHPDLADLPLKEVIGGWGNQMWRLGDDLAVRMPRINQAPEPLRREHQWLPGLAGAHFMKQSAPREFASKVDGMRRHQRRRHRP